MRQYLIDMYARLVSWQTLPSAAEQIDAVLGTFDSMVGKLTAAIDQAQSEVDASYEREGDAWDVYVGIADRERDLRGTIYAAERRATTARDRIAGV